MSAKDVLLKDRVSAARQMGNAGALANGRTFLSVIAGFSAGILGLTGVWGALFYVLSSFALSFCVLARLNFDHTTHFPSLLALFVSDFMGGTCVYVRCVFVCVCASRCFVSVFVWYGCSIRGL
jgi:hypothetical protein